MFRGIARQVLSSLPVEIQEAVRAYRRARTRRRGSRAVGTVGYPSTYRVGRPTQIDRPWPVPPAIASPASPAVSSPDPAPRVYDVTLFEELNAEYASRPIVPDAPAYDADSVAERSRRRLAGIHSRLGLADCRTLEIGCGSGFEVWYLAHHFGSDAWGIDIRKRVGWDALAGDRVHLIEGDIAGDHGLPQAAFDRVVSFTVWEHITRPRAALEQLYAVMKPGALAWIRANLYRGPTASHMYRHITFPFPHLLFTDAVIAEAMQRAGKAAVGAAWVNRLTWEQYEAYLLEIGFLIRSVSFDRYPLDEAFYRRFEDVLGRYPREDLERGFFTVVLERPR
jgi:SAM-dependent methyltransferase